MTKKMRQISAHIFPKVLFIKTFSLLIPTFYSVEVGIRFLKWDFCFAKIPIKVGIKVHLKVKFLDSNFFFP